MSEDQRPIHEFIWWVIPNKLLGVRKPTNQEEVEYLRSLNIKGIVTLLDDEENHELYLSSGMDFLWVPVKGGMPPTKDQVQATALFIEKMNDAGGAVAIHCNNGRKRTGAMLASQLVVKGENPEKAISRIVELNPEAKLSETQIQFLNTLKR